MASRWCSGNYCTVSAFCEMFAAWAAGRVGKRDFGANTYTAMFGSLLMVVWLLGVGFGWRIRAGRGDAALICGSLKGW